MYPVTKNTIATKLIGGIPPCQPDGSNGDAHGVYQIGDV